MKPRWRDRRFMKIEHLSVLATVVVAFAASTALILNGQSELRRDMWAGQAETWKDMRVGQAGLREAIRAVEAELHAGQAGIRKDLKSLDVRIAVVEQRTAGLPAEPGASAAEPAPAASLDSRHHSARASLRLARALRASFEFPAADGPQL